MRKTPQPMRGFTLVELLVVIAIIGILVGLMLPAVQSARESGRRLQCANNLKQLSLAVVSYTTTHRTLPPGSTGKWNGNNSFPAGWGDPKYGNDLPWGHFSWAAVILPQLEQQNLYDTIDFTVPAYAESIRENNTERGPAGNVKNKAAASMQPPVFVCPTARRVKPKNQFKDYGINHGTGACCPERSQANMNGVASVNSSIKPANIRDGMSNTLLFLEFAHWGSHSWVNVNEGTNQFLWVHHVSQGYVTCTEHPGTLTSTGLPNSAATPPNFTGYNHRGAFSDHPGGVQVTFCDGHLSWISNHIDFKVYRAMFTRAEGDIVGPY